MNLTKNAFLKKPHIPQKLNIEFPYDPAILLLGVCTNELKTGTQMLAHQCSFQHNSLFNSKRGKQLKRLSTRMDKQNMVYTT